METIEKIDDRIEELEKEKAQAIAQYDVEQDKAIRF